MGAFCFSSFTLAPGEKTDFILLSGIADSKEEIENIFEKYNTSDKVKNALEETRIYWKKQVNVDFHTQDPDFDSYMKWVSFQPFLIMITDVVDADGVICGRIVFLFC